MTPQQRQLVLNEAISWLDTPFHQKAAVKGKNGGIDCARYIAQVFKNSLGMETPVPNISLQMNLHKEAIERYAQENSLPDNEIYLYFIRKYWKEISKEQASFGDLIIPKLAHIFWHAAIIVNGTKVITAHSKAGKVIYCRVDVDDMFVGRECKYFTLP